MNYTAVGTDGDIEIWGRQAPNYSHEISYPRGSITQVRVDLMMKVEGGATSRSAQVVIHARMAQPALEIQTLTFDTNPEAESFYGFIVELLGWT